MAERDFKGIWIPRDIWTDKNLNFLEKCILMEIDSLDNGEGCYASNKYLADFCQCSERKISDAISLLEDLSLIWVMYVNNRRILESRISPRRNCEGGSKICEGGSKSCEGGSKICDQEIIVKNTNKETVVKDNIVPQKRFIPPTVEEVRAYCIERGNDINPETFVSYYESNGWMVGKKKMKDWKASVRYWESTRKKKSNDTDYEAMARELAQEMK